MAEKWIDVAPPKKDDEWQDVPPGFIKYHAPEPKPKSLIQKWDELPINSEHLSDKLTIGGHKVVDPDIADVIDPVDKRTESQWRIPEFVPYVGGGTYRSLYAGEQEAFEKFLRGASTPTNLALIAATGGAGALEEAGMPALAEPLHTLARIGSAGFVGTGIGHTIEAAKNKDVLGMIGGGSEALLGGLGATHGTFGEEVAPKYQNPDGTPAAGPRGATPPPPPPPPPGGGNPPMGPGVARGPAASNIPPGWLPFDEIPPEPSPVVEPPAPMPTETGALDFETPPDPTQGELNFGAYRSPAGRFTRTGPGLPPDVRPFLEEPIQDQLGFTDEELAQIRRINADEGGLTAPFDTPTESRTAPPEPPIEPVAPPSEPPAATPVAPPTEPPNPLREAGAAARTEGQSAGRAAFMAEQAAEAAGPGITVVNGQERVARPNWSKAQQTYWRNQGFMPSGQIDANGQIYWVRNPNAPITTPSVAPNAPERPAQRGAMGQNEISLSGSVATIPTSDVNPDVEARMAARGFRPTMEVNGNTIFKKTSETGELNIDLSGLKGGDIGDIRTRGQLENIGNQPQGEVTELPQVGPEQMAPRVSFGDFVKDITRRYLGNEVGGAGDISRELREDYARRNNVSPQDALDRQRINDSREITDAPDLSTLEQLVTYWRNRVGEHTQFEGGAESAHASEMLAHARERYDQVINQGQSTPILDPNNLPRVHPDDIAAHRAADLREISEARTVEDAEELERFWRDQVGALTSFDDAETATHIRRMYVEAGNRAAEIDRTPHPDLAEIQNTNDESELNAINQRWHRVWSENYGTNAALAQHADRMADAASARRDQLFPRTYDNAEAAADLQARIDREMQDANNPDFQEIALADTSEQLNNLLVRWHARRRAALDGGDSTGASYAERIISEINDTRNMMETEPPSSTRPSSPFNFGPPITGDTVSTPGTRRTPRNSYNDPNNAVSRNIDPAETRAATGVPNPPVRLGLQEPQPPGPLRLTQEQYTRLSRNADPYNQKEGPRPESMRRRNTWDDFADGLVDPYNFDSRTGQVLTGDPGLTIEQRNAQYENQQGRDKYYNLVYRGKNGNALAVARVVEDGITGDRSVPALGSKRFNGQNETTGINREAAHGVVEIFKTLADMNALEAHGSISEYTARLIAKAGRMLRDQRGSFSFDKAMSDVEYMKNLQDQPTMGGAFRRGPRTGRSAGFWSDLLARVVGEPFNRFADQTGELNIGNISNAAKEGIRGVFKEGEHGEPSTFDEAIAFPGAAMTGLDVSMPLRQGFTQIFTPEWWKALKPMFQAGFSAESARAIDAQIRESPIHQERYNPVTNTDIPSMAKEMGLNLIENGKVSASEYSIGSNWIENGGSIPGVSKVYRGSIGKLYRASNRAAATFLNHLRTNAAEKLLNAARDMAVEADTTGRARQPGLMGSLGFKQNYTPEMAADLNPYNNMKLAREIGDFINTATGRGPLKTHIFPVEGAPELNLERASGFLRHTLFSPRGLASKVRMMNPNTYIMASPFVRQQYLKAALSTGVAWYTMTKLMQGAANGLGYDDVSVSDDPNSADFGKLRIGDTRVDLGGGFLQMYVAMHRLITGKQTTAASSATDDPREVELGQGYRPPTRRSIAQDFLKNKLNPAAKFAYDLADASTHTPFHVADRTVQMFTSLVMGDLYSIYRQDPTLLPGLAPFIMLGASTQTYDRGESQGTFVPSENDYLFTGGGNAENLIPGMGDDNEDQQ